MSLKRKPYPRILCHRLGYVSSVQKDTFTAILSDRLEPERSDEEWEIEKHQVAKKDRKLISTGRIFRFFIVVAPHGIQARSKFVWNREKWTKQEIRYIEIRAKQFKRQWDKLT